MRHLVAVLVLGATALVSARLHAADSRLGKASAPREAAAFSPQSPIQIETLAATPSVSSGPVPIGIEADVYCTGWLGELDEPFTGEIVSAELMNSQKSFTQGDIVYIGIGAARGISAGQEYWICRGERLVNKWNSQSEEIGRIYRTPGRLRVICTQDETATAEIVLSCGEIEVGDRIIPFEPIPIPLVRRTKPVTACDPSNGKVLGHIVEVKDYATPAATDSVVFLDLGEKDGISAGDFFTVFRPRAESGAVRSILGELSILATRSRTATAIVTSTHDTMGVGDMVELK